MSKHSNSKNLKTWRIFHSGSIQLNINSKPNKSTINLNTMDSNNLCNHRCSIRSGNLSLNLKVTQTNLSHRNRISRSYRQYCYLRTSHSRYSNNNRIAIIWVKTKKLRFLCRLLQLFTSSRLRGAFLTLHAWITKFMIGGALCRTHHTTSLISITAASRLGSIKIIMTKPLITTAKSCNHSAMKAKIKFNLLLQKLKKFH